MASNEPPEIEGRAQPGTADIAPPADERTPLLHRGDGPSNGVGDGNGDGDIAASKPSLAERFKSLGGTRKGSFFGGFLSGLVVFAIILSLFGVYRARKMAPTAALCTTPACINAAAGFLANLSPDYKKIDACTDFDALVCDGWRARTQLRPEQGQASSFNSIADAGGAILKGILESPYPSTSAHSSFSPMNLAAVTVSLDQENFNQLQRGYNACLAYPAIQKAGIAPLEKTLQEFVKVLNGSSKAGDSSATWAEPLLWLERYGISSLLSIYPSADDKSPDTQIVFAGPRSSPGPFQTEFYTDPDVVAKYQDAMGEVLGAIKTTSKDAKKRAAAVVAFESKIAAITPALEDQQSVTKTYNPMTLQDTVKLAPQLGLDHVLKSLVPSNYTVDRMITSFPDYFTNLSSILAVTPAETVQTFFLWRLITGHSNYIDQATPEILPYFRFTRQLGGQDPDAMPERYRTCIRHVDRSLGWILSRFYVEAAFSEKAKDLGNQIVSDIKAIYVEGFKTLSWMDDSVQKLASEKVNKIVQKVGYPTVSPNIMDAASLRKYYSALNITDSFYDNGVASAKFGTARGWEALGKPTDRNEWGMSANTVNAYYNPPLNEIVFPAGIMQFPIFGGDLPGYVNYGAFGAVAGHELSHAFDPSGKLYDSDGRLNDWWTNHTNEEFEKRAQCFIEEYSNFTVTRPNGTLLHVNGKLTVGENVADAGGLSAAWRAWQSRRKNSPDGHLPGMDFFTQEQLFYVSYGNVWCSKATQEALVQGVLGDEHAPDMYRIKGTATMNSRGFREAFNCPVKEPICEIW